MLRDRRAAQTRPKCQRRIGLVGRKYPFDLDFLSGGPNGI